LINPFDFVVVESVENTRTIGMVTSIRSITDAESHLANIIGRKIPEAEQPVERLGGLICEATVLRNLGYQIGRRSVEIRMPVPPDKEVYYADEEMIRKAVGADLIKGVAIPAGVTRQTSGISATIPLDSHYLLGPEGAHANASGISGLATKTSYLMFLLLFLHQKIPKEVASIIFNVKYSDLLHIREPASSDEITDEDKELYETLDLKPVPFENVRCLLPRAREGKPASYEPPTEHTLYAFELNDVYDELDLLFSEVPDPWGTVARFTTGLSRSWRKGAGMSIGLNVVRNWSDLLGIADENFGEYFGISAPAPQRIKAELHRLTRNHVYVNERTPEETYLREEIKKIKAGEIIVVDIFPLPRETQTFVVGDVMRAIEELYEEAPKTLPRKILLLIDELNEFAPRGEITSLSRMIVDIARKGRSRGTILFSAQQFKSQVHDQIHGNCSTHIVGRTGGSELQHATYAYLDQSAKQDAMALGLGELIVSFPVWRRPVKGIFPRPPYRIPKR